MMTTVVLSLAAATCFALATVLQHGVAASAPMAHSMRPSLVLHVARRRQWIFGKSLDAVALLLQGLALARGSLLVVQPVLACSVLLALPIDAIATNRRLSRTALFGAAATATGLATFLLAGRPSKGHATAGVLAWSLGAGTIAVVLIACVVSARSPRTPQQRGALWAVAAACCYGLSSACMKQATTVIGTWSWHMFVDPAVIGCVVAGMLGLLLAQSAFQVASLPASMGLLTAVEPVAGAFLGMVVFDEHLRAGAGGITATAAGAMVTIVGVLLVTSSSPRAADERTPLARFDVRSEDSVFEL
jgi:drug/metabolite transporter (DMT)-like permease